MITNFQGQNLNGGLKNDATKIFEKSLKLMQICQILQRGMNFSERLQKNQMSLAVRSALVWGFDFAALFQNLTGGYNV